MSGYESVNRNVMQLCAECCHFIRSHMKYIVPFIACKTFYAVDVWRCCYCCLSVTYISYQNLNMRQLHDKKVAICPKQTSLQHLLRNKHRKFYCKNWRIYITSISMVLHTTNTLGNRSITPYLRCRCPFESPTYLSVNGCQTFLWDIFDI